MKIIGETNGGFIATISNEEVKSLLALGDTRREKIKDAIRVGVDLSFTLALQNLSLVKDIQISGSYTTLGYLKNAQEQLTKIIESIEGLKVPLYQVQETIKTGQA